MVGKRKTEPTPERDAPPLPSDPQPVGTERDLTLGEEEEPMVVYRGMFGMREITAAQWAAAGVPDMPTILWERRLGFKVPKSAFTEKALQVLRQDQGFQVP